MSSDALVKEPKPDIQWYEDDILLRGCHLTLPQIKLAYRELAVLTKHEGERIVGSLQKIEGESEEQFRERVLFLKDDAFRITVSIIGFDKQTTYGETEEIFDSKNLPMPIRTVFFTNANSFKRHASGNEPPNRFSVWLHFDKPPLFDPYPLVSEPTRNASEARINSNDLGYYRAVQNIIKLRLGSHRKWYCFIHEKFAYDVGLWFFALPYSLYWVTVYSDWLFPSDGKYASFRVAFYVYSMGMSLLAYRALFSYVKWAFPVNVLDENKDLATRHRVMLGAVVFGLVASWVRSMIGMLLHYY